MTAKLRPPADRAVTLAGQSGGLEPGYFHTGVNSSLTDGHAYVTYGSTIWELVGTRIQYKFEILVVFLVGMDII